MALILFCGVDHIENTSTILKHGADHIENTSTILLHGTCVGMCLLSRCLAILWANSSQYEIWWLDANIRIKILGSEINLEGKIDGQINRIHNKSKFYQVINRTHETGRSQDNTKQHSKQYFWKWCTGSSRGTTTPHLYFSAFPLKIVICWSYFLFSIDSA
jgi:hypothetical protein